MQRQFQALTQLLRAHRVLWQCQPFVQLDSPWQHSHPELAVWLDGRADTPDWLAAGPLWLQELARASAELGALPTLPHASLPPIGADAARRIAGRKVRQIEQFSAAVLPVLTVHRGTLVDWCAGKGHLGRTLAQHLDCRLLGLEWDPSLVAAGQGACDQLGVPAEFACVDVRTPAAAAMLQPDHRVVALHACGDLHAALLAAAIARQVHTVAVAPCCYNLAAPTHHHALSVAGRAADLRLTLADLDLLHREPLVATPRDRARAQQDQAWRLGFDLLQRSVTGSPTYRTMPPFARPWLRLPFDQFCQQFAALDGLALPASLPWAEFEAQGWQRLALVARRERLRGLFRAPLEAWLVLDRALVLAEAELQVAVGTFCPREVTPRNALIVGWR